MGWCRLGSVSCPDPMEVMVVPLGRPTCSGREVVVRGSAVASDARSSVSVQPVSRQTRWDWAVEEISVCV